MKKEMIKGAGDAFRVVVDYTKSLAEMISAGNYDWFDADIRPDCLSNVTWSLMAARHRIDGGLLDICDYVQKKHNPVISDKIVKDHGQVELCIELIHYGRRMQSDDIIRDIKSHGLRPTTLPELLAFGAAYPNKQRKFPIVALGSVCRDQMGIPLAPYLKSDDFKRKLCLVIWKGDWKNGWEIGYRFAAVRN